MGLVWAASPPEQPRVEPNCHGWLLKVANEGRAAIVFVDELDSLMGNHSNEVGGEIRVKNQFLKEMDGITDKGKNLHIYVIGATNKPWDLDWAFIRRFQKRRDPLSIISR